MTVSLSDQVFVYVDDEYNILAVTHLPCKMFENHINFNVDYEEVKDIMEGKKSMIHYTVSPSPDDPLTMKIAKKNYEIDYLRTLDHFLTEVRENLDITAHIIIKNFIKSKRVVVELNEGTRSKILKEQPVGTKLTIMGSNSILLYFTTKNDPSVLFGSHQIGTAELIEEGKIEFKYDGDYSNASVFTKKIFPNYLYEVIDE